MGVTQSSPEPFRRFRKYSLGDAREALRLYNTRLFGHFLLSHPEVALLIGGDTGCAMAICRDLLPVVEGKRVSALALLVGIAAVCKPEASNPIGAKAALAFDCCDLQQCGALNRAELTALVVSFTRALEAMFDLKAMGEVPGNQSLGFDSAQTSALVGHLFGKLGTGGEGDEAKVAKAAFVDWARQFASETQTPCDVLLNLRLLADGGEQPAAESGEAEAAEQQAGARPPRTLVPFDEASQALFG